ncbi:MAG: class I SAM-dependent methyltransferase [Candidatus Hodarchaeales archaeon]|jgi:ubiquinone/menaquinone biosynthesis C-methylase UbiE
MMPSSTFKSKFRESYYSFVFAVYDRMLYDRLPKIYDLVFGSSHDIGEAFNRIISDLEPGSILDVACGTGTLLALASNKGLDCYGVDLSEGMLKRAMSKVPKAELKQGNFENIPYPGNTFDYVVSTNALGSLMVNPARVVSEMLRVCRKGGEVKIADYNYPPAPSYKSKILTRFFRLLGDTPYDFTRIFRDLGYDPRVTIIGLYDMYQLLEVRK